MADIKTQKTKVSVKEFIAALPDETRRQDANALIALMKKVTGEKPAMWGPSIIGFGSYHYKYDSGREGDMARICFAPRKAATVLYVATDFPGADALLAKVGKLTGKGCLSVKRVADVDPKALQTLIEKTLAAVNAKYPSRVVI